MPENITHELILQYIYGETTAATDILVKEAMVKDPQILLYYNEIMEVKQMLTLFSEEPNPTSVAIISEFSHDSHTEAV